MSHFAAVTPSNTADLPAACSAFWIGGSGDLKVIALEDDDTAAVVLPAVPVGLLQLPWPVRRIVATGTSATGIIGLGF